MIYHLLPEVELFSTYRGGAIAKNIANIMRLDEAVAVVCQKSDGTWDCANERVIVPPLLHPYRRIPGRRFLPLWVLNRLLHAAFKPFLSKLTSADVVWCHNQPFYCAALERAIHSKGATLIYQSHDRHATSAIKNAFRSFTADAYVFVSEALRQRWLQLFPDLKNTYVVYNGADEELFYPKPQGTIHHEDPAVVLYVGRISREKGVHVLIEAMRILHERNVPVLCNVIGSSFNGGSTPTPYVRALRKSRPANVEFKGYVSCDKIPEEYRASQIVCCPSVCLDAFPGVPLEGMASGIPVVATRVGGIPEIAAEGGVVLVEPDSAVELADALQKLIEDPGLRARVAADGLRSFRKRFTWLPKVHQYHDIIRSCKQARRAASA